MTVGQRICLLAQLLHFICIIPASTMPPPFCKQFISFSALAYPSTDHSVVVFALVVDRLLIFTEFEYFALPYFALGGCFFVG